MAGDNHRLAPFYWHLCSASHLRRRGHRPIPDIVEPVNPIDGLTADAEGGQGWTRDQVGPEFGVFVHRVLSELQVMVTGRIW
jgi:hypothetical protein